MIYDQLLRPIKRAAIEYQIQIKDHACLRVFWNNFARVDNSGMCYRSGHPSRLLLCRAKELGVKHILSLRGGHDLPHNIRERELCTKLGLSYENVSMSSSNPPTKRKLQQLIHTFENFNEPFLMHCKTGADRTGLAAGIYHLSILKGDANGGKKQLTYKHLHFGLGKKSVLKKFFDFYQCTNLANESFKTWVNTTYSSESFVNFLNKK